MSTAPETMSESEWAATKNHARHKRVNKRCFECFEESRAVCSCGAQVWRDEMVEIELFGSERDGVRVRAFGLACADCARES